MSPHTCPNCKAEISFNQVITEQYKKEIECKNCRKKLDFKTNKLFIFIFMIATFLLPNELIIRFPYVILMILFFFPISSLFFGFKIINERKD